VNTKASAVWAVEPIIVEAERVNDCGTPVVMRLVSKRVYLAAALALFSAD
jgi:hypothetical protein